MENNTTLVVTNQPLAQLDEIDMECLNTYRTEQRVRKLAGSQQLNSLGYGHRLLGAKNHGKSTKVAGGAGYGRSRMVRLFK